METNSDMNNVPNPIIKAVLPSNVDASIASHLKIIPPNAVGPANNSAVIVFISRIWVFLVFLYLILDLIIFLSHSHVIAYASVLITAMLIPMTCIKIGIEIHAIYKKI